MHVKGLTRRTLSPQKSAGQSGPDPSHISAASHSFPAARHSMLSSVWYNTSSGQAPLSPGQLSSGSQTPAEGRQVVVALRKPSTQVSAVPRQESVPSQRPPVDVPVQAVVEGWKASAGHAPDEPVQLSSKSH